MWSLTLWCVSIQFTSHSRPPLKWPPHELRYTNANNNGTRLNPTQFILWRINSLKNDNCTRLAKFDDAIRIPTNEIHTVNSHWICLLAICTLAYKLDRWQFQYLQNEFYPHAIYTLVHKFAPKFYRKKKRTINSTTTSNWFARWQFLLMKNSTKFQNGYRLPLQTTPIHVLWRSVYFFSLFANLQPANYVSLFLSFYLQTFFFLLEFTDLILFSPNSIHK